MFITMEGIDGCGKSTQAARLDAVLRRAGKAVLLTREPGGWSQGDALRSILLGGNLKHPTTEILLFMADRCEHVRQVIEPALSSGKFVICDRFSDSTRAYQCWGRGQDRQKVEDLIAWLGIPDPDLTFWLDLSLEDAFMRRKSRGVIDRFETEERKFHGRVAEGFKKLADEYSARIVRIDATLPEEQVEREICAVLKKRGIL